MIEKLETRKLLAAVVDGLNFRIDGTAGDDAIVLVLNETTATLIDNGVESTLEVPVQSQLRIFLGDGNDTLDVRLFGRSIPATVYGGAGDDAISFGALDETLRIYGEDGNDEINLRFSAPTPRQELFTFVYGGAGNDRYIGGGASVDRFFGNAGADRAEGGVGVDILRGDGGNDTLIGNDGDDSLSGGSGNDFLLGGLGSDTLIGSDGFDVLLGHGMRPDGDTTPDGNNVLSGGNEGDTLYGDSGNDTIVGGSGANFLAGDITFNFGYEAVFGVSADIAGFGGEIDYAAIPGATGNDLLIGGDDNDNLIGGFGNDSLYGNAGDDALDVSDNDGDDLLDGGGGRDLLGPNRLNIDAVGSNGAGNDTLFGGPGKDTLTGGPGNDSITGGLDADIFNGQDFADGEVQDFNDSEDTIEATYGIFDDVFTVNGDAGVNQIELRRGNSQLDDFPDPNKLYFRFLGIGSQQYELNQITKVRVFLAAGDDSINFIGLPDTIDVTVYGGAGDDTVVFDQSDGTFRFYGEDGDDVAAIYRGDPGTGRRILYGGAGNDLLEGNTADDYIIGGPGLDTLTGNVGADVFAADEESEITDFMPDVDELS